MSATIFCTFEQQDLADLAMGHVRQIRGVKTIHYIVDHSAGQRLENATNRGDDTFFGFGFFGMTASYGAEVPSMPASVKITCDDAARQEVVSTLVNLHAYKIVTQ